MRKLRSNSARRSAVRRAGRRARVSPCLLEYLSFEEAISGPERFDDFGAPISATVVCGPDGERYADHELV